MMCYSKFFFMYQLIGSLLVAIVAAGLGYVYGFLSCVILISVYVMGLFLGVRIQHSRGK